jgi:hypothetical protein
MTEEKLIGGVFEGCRFSRGSYEFEFMSNREIYRLGTSCSVSTKLEDMLAKKDAEGEISKQVWDLLETELTAIEHLDGHYALRFEFSQGGEIYIWSDENAVESPAVYGLHHYYFPEAA